MDFTISKDNLVQLLTQPAGVAAQKSSIDVLKCVLLRAVDGHVHATATDQVVSIEKTLPATVKFAGSACIPAKRAFDVAKACHPGDVRVRSSKNYVEISAGRSKFKIDSLPAEDFPAMVECVAVASIDASLLASLVANGSYAMSADDTRPALNACSINFENHEVTVVSTDGYRLALAKAPEMIESVPSVLVPFRGANELCKVCARSSGDIGIGVSGNHIVVSSETTRLTVRMTDAAFIPYKSVIPNNQTRIDLDRMKFIDALKRASVGNDSDTVSMEFEPTLLTVSSEDGSSFDVIECDSGIETKMFSSARYLIDSASHATGDTITMRINSCLDPILIESNGYMALVMPKRI